MQSVLHIPETAVQEVTQLCQINKLSVPLIHNRVRAVLKKYHADMDETVMKEVTRAMSDIYMMTFLFKNL